MSAIAGLDHVLIGVRDLEAARAAYARLGFTATPRGRHTGWGTANYCLMFAGDYIELLGIVDPGAFTNDLDRFLERREGLLGLAFACDDAETAHAALRAAGIAAAPPKALSRALELAEGAVEPRFRLVHLPPEASPGLSAFLCQHLTPGIIRRPAWLEHPNGALGIAAVTTVVADPPALRDAYARLLGPGATTPTDDVLAARAGKTALIFATPDDFATLYPEVEPPPDDALPLPAALTIAVADPAQTARLLDAGGVAYMREAKGALVVTPDHAHGVALEFATAAGG